MATDERQIIKTRQFSAVLAGKGTSCPYEETEIGPHALAEQARCR